MLTVLRCGNLTDLSRESVGLRACAFSLIDKPTLKTTRRQNDTHTNNSQFGCPDRNSRADVRGCSESGARQETQYPVHHGRGHRLDAAELLSSRPDGGGNAEH